IAINFIILPEFFQVAFSMLKEEKNYLRDFLIESLGGGSNSTSYLWFHVTHELPIQNLVENMVWSILNDQPNKRSINQNTMGLLILQLLNYMDKMEAGTNAYEKEFTITVFNYIENHYKNGTLAELAGLLKRDIYWVSKEIKKRTGKTYKDLLMEKRLSQSGYLLKNTKLPVASIIEMVGYDNSSYFYRKFKETYQKTPNEYREESDKLGPY
ncbi:MAG TPA: AraC family transcriptional regulator, partial [Candidatus Dorea intestinavium]|nr:AraC family transcriptional regulator [Candidatus Dorea intestinavium]